MAEKLRELLAHAEECRRLAETMPDEEQQQALLRMAATWERLAQERQERVGSLDEGIRPQNLTSENDG